MENASQEGIIMNGTPSIKEGRLPVFKLVEPKVDRDKAASIMAYLHGGKLPPDAKGIEETRILGHSAGKKELEIYKASGGIFLRDTEHLWNPKLKPVLPNREKANEIAHKFLYDNKLLPGEDQHVKISFAGFTETAGVADGQGKLEKISLDLQTNYKVEIAIQEPKGQELLMPVIGGGGKFKVAIGEGGSVIGHHGVWRPIAEVASMVDIMSQAEVEEKFKKMAGGLKVTKIDSFLAYYSAPAFEEQAHLAPVWVVKAEAEVGRQKVPLRNAIFAATDFGPKYPKIPAKTRSKGEKPVLLERVINPYEAGTSWIGPSQGLGGSPANAKGFVDGLGAAGWIINFNWGEAAAFESDWNRDANNWVEGADFVFYTGHANENGWVLNNPDDTFLNYSEVGTSPANNHYGKVDLEWIIIAACGPHESNHFTTNVSNAFDRWRPIFKGLHIFMGYGSVTNDNTQEGARVVELARAGWPIIDAWFRTAWEIQPSSNGYSAPYGSTVFVTAMYAHMGDHATRYDHIWGTGNTVADPVGLGQQRYLMWSST
jgi:hypothetical protein